ncbi:MAG: RNA polymerase ECF-type sigma factor [Candidatus Yanofskybacteria bacterium GW2011_GWD2_39_48]|uniref:RNA polymerase ECF-type sigma factor n=1 Tax=Candidatus Yanofskybacteria bacterium GW2011_GWD2_39_48 TaxID=1619031 RepID=A0A0G0PF41_9BACT|nr:MAG: RNA polymerase ECF-type sigma factor [Candidatus Yanofskybacteria bacterium GW2011_GWD2_39_48]
MHEISDENLISIYLKNDDEKALEALIARYFGYIYGFILRRVGDKDTAHDITQETFVKTWQSLKSFRPEGHFKSWLFMIATNSMIDWQRSHQKTIPFSTILENNPGYIEHLEDVNAHKNVRDLAYQRELLFALAKVPSLYTKIIKLHSFRGLNFREISQQLKEPLNTVKSRYRRGLILVRNILSEI